MAVIELNKENFDKEAKSGVVIVDFFASWCGPCQMMGPVFDELSDEVEGVKFARVSTEDSPDLASLYAVRSIPCFIIFKDGEEVDRIIGGQPKDELKKHIEAIK